LTQFFITIPTAAIYGSPCRDNNMLVEEVEDLKAQWLWPPRDGALEINGSGDQSGLSAIGRIIKQ
jgi:hypothetical protein